ncbi:hypothetical protein PLICRDRAFT_41778 [Plicaturopsis crispa FD-325 SS-3]|nr:hypothetical protein PLICRDRAFT_41778 [Plicaturopsis crispa FD-325 SS-3]
MQTNASIPISPDDASRRVPGTGTVATKKTPAWVPLSMLAVSTVALVVPVVLLRRHRANNTLRHELAPRRRAGNQPAKFAQPAPSPSLRATPTPMRSAETSSELPAPSPDAHAGAALYTAKVFGLATLLVTSTAAISVFGLKAYMGVKDTKEFGERMRNILLTKMHVLTSRIHRLPIPSDHTPSEDASPQEVHDFQEEEWNWQDAEKRLKESFERDGFSGWMSAAMREAELEGNLERKKRGLATRTDSQ